jgi:uncharacterized protein YbjT (DUF2867 family)
VKVLITGASGQVGHALAEACPAAYNMLLPDQRALNLAESGSLYQRLSVLECTTSFAALGMRQNEWRAGLCKMLAALEAPSGQTKMAKVAREIRI